jgi:hypothetical protein
MVAGVVSVLLCIAGAIYDGVVYNELNQLVICRNTDDNKVVGDDSSENVLNLGENCAKEIISASAQCLCVTAKDDSDCSEFDLKVSTL